MNSIAIRLVKVDGYYVAADLSSAWNLSALGIGPIKAERNQRELKAHRRAWDRTSPSTSSEAGPCAWNPPRPSETLWGWSPTPSPVPHEGFA